MDVSLCAKIQNALKDRAPDDSRKYIGASSIGHPCDRKIWYQFKGELSENSPRSKTTLDIGKKVESLLLDYLELTDIQVIRPNKDNDFLHCESDEFKLFQGHLDAILIMPHSGMSVILDIKTAKASSFQKFVNKGLRLWDSQYHAQLQSYMGMTGISHAVILTINKDTSEIHEEWVSFDDLVYSELTTRAKRIASFDYAPERINRSPLYYTCSMCGFKDICHE